MSPIVEFVRVRTTFADVADYALTTPEDIETARRHMREAGVENLPILQNGDGFEALETGRSLRANAASPIVVQPVAPRKFVVINDEVFYLRNAHDIADAQDAMVDYDVEKKPIHSEDGLCDDLDVLYARVFVAIPYTKTYSDDHGESTYAIVRARDVKHAIELVTCRGGGLIDDECWWSKAANASGDSVERSDSTCFYLMWPCDCGDNNCQDENSPHDSQTETIVFQLDLAVEYPTRDAAVAANSDREPAVEYLET